MPAPRIEFEPFINEGARQFIAIGIDFFNVAATGLPDYFPVNFVLRGESGDVLGGVLGQVWGGWLQVSHLWIAEAAATPDTEHVFWGRQRHMLALGARSGPRSRHTASRRGRFMSGSVTRYSARSTVAPAGTANSS